MMKNRVQLFAMLFAVAALSACGAKPTSAPSGVAPNALVTIEAAAEDIIDLAPGGTWDAIGKDVTNIANAWKSYETRADKDGVSQELQDAMISAIGNLQTASAAKDAAATMQGSNDVSAAVVEMFALYSPNIPADIGRLDVLERQVILDVAAQDYSAAEINLAKTRSIWEEVKPSALEQNGQDVAAQFEASLAAQESALTANDDTALTTEARTGLEIVDALEQLY
jgi:hypothetical protein